MVFAAEAHLALANGNGAEMLVEAPIRVAGKHPSRGFYERLGAVAVGQGQVSLGGENHDQTAYRWNDLAKLSGDGRFSA